MAKKKAQQLQVPGTERETIPEIDGAAKDYADLVSRRVGLQAKEKEAKDALLALMKGKNLTIYRFDTEDGDTMEVTLKPTDVKLRVRKVDPDSTPGSSVDGESVDDGNGSDN